MPALVWFARQGSVLTVDGNDLLGWFKTAKIEISTKESDHSGPMDNFVHRTPIRKEMSLTIDGFNPTSGDSFLVPIGQRVTVTMDVVTGETITGEFIVVSANSTGDENASTGSMTLHSSGGWTGPGGADAINQ